jgi:ferredoxin
MRITADRERCIGAGQCVLTDPEMFDQSEEDNTVILLAEQVRSEQLDRVRFAVRICPSGALSIAGN